MVVVQTVGMNCGLCNQPIRAAIDARGCLGCENAFHRACITEKYIDDEKCPRCQRSFAEQAIAAANQRHTQISSELASGERLLKGGLAVAFLMILVSSVVYMLNGRGGIALFSIAVAMVPAYAG